MKLEARFPKEEKEIIEQLRSEVKEEIVQEIKDSPHAQLGESTTADETKATARDDESRTKGNDTAQNTVEHTRGADPMASQGDGASPQQSRLTRADGRANRILEDGSDMKSPTDHERGNISSTANCFELMLSPDAVPLAPPSLAQHEGSSSPHASLTDEDRTIIRECTKQIRILLQALQSSNAGLPAASVSRTVEDHLLEVRFLHDHSKPMKRT